MIKRETFKQETPEVVWNVSVPEGAYKARPLAAYGSDGNSKEIDSWSFEDGILHVNFGIDPASGELEYEYLISGTHQPIPEVDKPLVNITNNYGGVNLDHGSFH